MDARQLRYFVAIFEQRNLSRAASLCNVAQSALSHQVGRLEKELGTTLFTRQPRGMEPTAAGQRLYEHAIPILRSITAAEDDIRNQSDEVSGELSLGMAYSAIEGMALPLMARFAQDYPKVRLTLTEALSVNTQENLQSRQIDLGLFYNPQPDPRIDLQPLLEEQVHCVGAPALIGPAEVPISFDEVCDLPVLLLRQGHYARAHVDRSSLLGKLRNLAPLQLNSVRALTKALIAGLGCTLAPLVTFRDALDSGRLVYRPITDPDLSRTLYIGRLRDSRPTRLVEAATKVIRDVAAEEVRSGRWDARPR